MNKTHVVIAASGYINPSSSSGLHDVIGGSYQGSVEGDSYLEITGDIQMQGGNHLNPGCMKGDGSSGDGRDVPDVYVGGNATLIYDNKNSTAAFPAIEGTYGCEMKGDVTLDVRAGSVAGIVGTEEPVDKSIIRGNLHIIAGNPAYENTDRVLRLGSNWPIIGAGHLFAAMPGAVGNYAVNGDIVIDTYENVWAWDKGTKPTSDDLPNIYGALRGDVGGSITINAHGSHVENITGASDSSTVGGDVTINATNVELKNSYYEDPDYDEGDIYANYDSIINGKCAINVDGGDVNIIRLTNFEQINEGSQITITGSPKIRTGVVSTSNYDTTPENVAVTLTDCTATIPFIQSSTHTHVTNKSDVKLNGLWLTGSLTVDEGSILKTDDLDDMELSGNVVVNGTWEQLFINSSRAAAYDVTIVGTMTVGTSGKYIGHGSTHVAGDVSSCGMMALMKPSEFGGNKPLPPPIPDKKPVCEVGSTVYLENDQRFTVESIGQFDVHLRNEDFPLVGRAVSREQFQQLLDTNPRNGGMVLSEQQRESLVQEQREQALSYIEDYLKDEFEITEPDFSDLTQIGLGYTTTEDEQHTIQVNADLEHCTISKFVDDTLYAQEKFSSLEEMNRKFLSILDFDSLMEVDINEIEEQEPEISADEPEESTFVSQVMQDVDRLAAREEPAEYDRTNYLAPYEPVIPEGAKSKFAANVQAIRTLKEIEQRMASGGAPATEQEQDILAGYLGWGGLADAFDPGKDNWHTEYEQLKTLLTEDEYAAARESTLTAFYTPPAVIHAMYRALEHIGCVGGNVLEPSMGVGAFFGHRHSKFDTHNAKLYGVELDSLSGRIAQQLYQKAKIQITGYEKADLPDNFFDLAIGNVPFGQYQVSDRRYDKLHFQIHDYFLANAGIIFQQKLRKHDLVALADIPKSIDQQRCFTEKGKDVRIGSARGRVRFQQGRQQLCRKFRQRKSGGRWFALRSCGFFGYTSYSIGRIISSACCFRLLHICAQPSGFVLRSGICAFCIRSCSVLSTICCASSPILRQLGSSVPSSIIWSHRFGSFCSK